MTTNRFDPWPEVLAAGLRDLNEGLRPQYEQARRIRVYSPALIAGPLQTAAYTRAILTRIRDHEQLAINDVEQAVAARVARTSILHDPGHHYTILLEQSVLYTGCFDDATLAEQLRHVHTMTEQLPKGTIGIVPADRPGRPWAEEGFFIFDEDHVSLELVSRKVELYEPGDVAAYVRAFDSLADVAVYGAEAGALLAEALAAVGGGTGR